jgi:uncharacterized protein YjbI with pentapeptide repeats
MIGVNLSEANLTGANFSCCDLTEADLSGACMNDTRFVCIKDGTVR